MGKSEFNMFLQIAKNGRFTFFTIAHKDLWITQNVDTNGVKMQYIAHSSYHMCLGLEQKADTKYVFTVYDKDKGNE